MTAHTTIVQRAQNALFWKSQLLVVRSVLPILCTLCVTNVKIGQRTQFSKNPDCWLCEACAPHSVSTLSSVTTICPCHPTAASILPGSKYFHKKIIATKKGLKNPNKYKIRIDWSLTQRLSPLSCLWNIISITNIMMNILTARTSLCFVHTSPFLQILWCRISLL